MELVNFLMSLLIGYTIGAFIFIIALKMKWVDKFDEWIDK